MTTLRDAHLLVTGGSSGIGLACARLAAERGARVSLVARDEARLIAAAATITGGSVATAAADVTDDHALRAAMEDLVTRHGPVDVLLAAAGGAYPGYFEQLDDGVFRDQMELDYFGTLHAVRAVVPSMLERGRGHLVTVASTAALVGVFGYSAYAPAKYAVRGLAETLRSELGPRGIVVACAYPPDTETPGLTRENETKPHETHAVSAAIKPRSAARVARAVVRGIEKDRAVITADLQTAALAHLPSVALPVARRSIERAVRKARRNPGP